MHSHYFNQKTCFIRWWCPSAHQLEVNPTLDPSSSLGSFAFRRAMVGSIRNFLRGRVLNRGSSGLWDALSQTLGFHALWFCLSLASGAMGMLSLTFLASVGLYLVWRVIRWAMGPKQSVMLKPLQQGAVVVSHAGTGGFLVSHAPRPSGRDQKRPVS